MTRPTPKTGDRILVFKERWRDLVLRRRKTMEIRCAPLKAGRYWIGCRGKITGLLCLGEALRIPDTAAWEALRGRHCVEDPVLPYARTYGLPILWVRSTEPHAYKHPRGAIGIVIYKA